MFDSMKAGFLSGGKKKKSNEKPAPLKKEATDTGADSAGMDFSAFLPVELIETRGEILT